MNHVIHVTDLMKLNVYNVKIIKEYKYIIQKMYQIVVIITKILIKHTF